MFYLFLDFEASMPGLKATNWRYRLLRRLGVDMAPKTVEVAWRLVRADGQLLHEEEHIVRRWWIWPSTVRCHGISIWKSLFNGVSVTKAFRGLRDLAVFYQKTHPITIVCHDYRLEKELLELELKRIGWFYPGFNGWICTAAITKGMNGKITVHGKPCRLKLGELYQFLFNKQMPEGAHRAMFDVLRVEECFFELVRKGHITQQSTITNAPLKEPKPPTPPQSRPAMMTNNTLIEIENDGVQLYKLGKDGQRWKIKKWYNPDLKPEWLGLNLTERHELLVNVYNQEKGLK